jgi:hypothetical protein
LAEGEPTHDLRRRWDINTRTQIISLGPALLLTLLLISFFTFVRIQDLRQELNHTGQLIANQLAPATEYGVISGNNEVLESLLRATLATRTCASWKCRTAPTGSWCTSNNRRKPQPPHQVEVFQAPIRLQRIAWTTTFSRRQSQQRPATTTWAG